MNPCICLKAAFMAECERFMADGHIAVKSGLLAILAVIIGVSGLHGCEKAAMVGGGSQLKY